ncbi:MAG TPA: guanylate kinase [Gemmatimonadaceae bacterium]|jgi:guanylate kinase|nr:guanylate kinase [Gemmatimonadaceae bacterium]
MPFPIILSSPSGGGKTTIAHMLLAMRPDVGYSVSCTTRPARPGEVDGKDYHFISLAKFKRDKAARKFAESAEVHGHLYGTLRAEVKRVLSSGRHVIMDIDVQGSKQFARAFPDSVLIFIVPPSAEVLVERLKARGTEDRKSLIRRFKSAKDELKAIDLYQYVIVNDEIDSAVAAVSSIIDAEGFKRSRNETLDARVEELMDGIQRAIDQYSARK